VRYRGDGSRDLGFGDDGVVVTDVGSSSDTGSSLAIQPDGRLVVAGTSSDGVNNDYSTARYDGSVCGDSIVEWGEECDDGNTIDDDGCSSACLLNRPPSCAHAFASISRLWPPTGRMADVAIRGVTDPDGDPIAITISGVTQDEPVHAGGDHSCPDAAGVGTSVAQLRSERQGNGDGRVYHVSFRANDSRRGICTGILSVCVPHDQGKGSRCVDEGAVTDSAMGCSTARRSG
jgi:cysteine-rich repeat protein